MKVALFEEAFFDAGFDAFTKERAIGEYDSAVSARFEKVDDEGEKEIGGFFGLEDGGEIGFDAGFFHAAEGRVGQDVVNTVAVAIGSVGLAGEGVVVVDQRHFHIVKDEIGHAEQMGQRLFFDAANGVVEAFEVVGIFDVASADVLQGADEKTACTAGGIKN